MIWFSHQAHATFHFNRKMSISVSPNPRFKAALNVLFCSQTYSVYRHRGVKKANDLLTFLMYLLNRLIASHMYC